MRSTHFLHLPLGAAALALIVLAGCAGDGMGTGGDLQPTAAPVPPAVPATLIAGRWGLAAYHRDEDRERTVQMARSLCGNAYEIGLGPSGGVVMHVADEPQPLELAVKGAAGNRTFVGPGPDPGAPQDREIVSYDGQIMIMRWVDPEVASRYGTTVFARCPDRRQAAPASRQPPR